MTARTTNHVALSLLAVVLVSGLPPALAGSAEPTPERKLPPVFKSWEQAKDWVLRMKNAAEQSDKDELSNLKQGHPRLIISNADLERVKKTISSDENAALLLEKLRHKADRMLDQPAVVYKKAFDNNILELSRTAQKRIVTLAGLYLLEGRKAYLDRAKLEMKAIASMSDWDPPHFLDTAEMTAALALGYDWLYDELSKDEEKQFRKAILELGLKQGLKEYGEHRWWTFSGFNWNIVCNGGLIVGALAIGDKHPEVSNRIITCARMSVPYAMASFAPDGGWAEGAGYWCYTTKYAMLMLSSLKSALGTDFDWMSSPGFSKTGLFRIHYTSPTGKYFNFADSSDEERRAPQMYWLSNEFDKPLYAGAEMGTAMRETTMFHLLFYPEKISHLENGDLPRAALFKGTATGFYRSNWSDPGALYIGFKGGSNRANHANLDLGTFVLDWSGVRWATEMGPDNYALPGYFGKERWSYYRLKTEGQNTFTINDTTQSLDAKAAVTSFEDKPGKFVADIDLAEAYPESLAGARRTFEVIRRNGKDERAVVTDTLKALRPVSYTWHMHTTQEVKQAPDGRNLTLRAKGGKLLKLRIISPSDCSFRTEEIRLQKPQLASPDVTDIKVRIPKFEGERKISIEFLRADSEASNATQQGRNE